MKKSSKRLPISAAKEIGKSFDKDQVIVIAWNREIGDTWVTTWGKTIHDCSEAAEGGNKLKIALGWPENKAKAMPAREKQLRKKILFEIGKKLETLDMENIFGLNHYEVRDVTKLLNEME